MISTTISTVAQTYPYSFYKVGEKWAEDIHADIHAIFRAIIQDQAVGSALQRMQDLGRVSNKVPALSSRAAYIAGWIPYTLVACIVFKDKLPSKNLQDALQFFHDHLGAAAFSVSLVSAVALIYFGQFFVGGFTLAFMALGELKDKDYLPDLLARGVDILGFGAVLYATPSWCLRMASLLTLIVWFYPSSQEQTFQPTDISQILDLDQAALLAKCEVDREHCIQPTMEGQDLRAYILRDLHDLRESEFDEFVSDFCPEQYKETASGFLKPGFGLATKQTLLPPLLESMAFFPYREAFYCQYYTKESVVNKAYGALEKHCTAWGEGNSWDAWLKEKGLIAEVFNKRHHLRLYLIENGILKVV